MATTVSLYDVTATAGSKVVAALLLPAGLTTGGAVTVSGGGFSGTQNVTAAATVVYLSLSESPSGNFGGTFTIGGTALSDTTSLPYTVQAKVVDAGTTITTYAGLAAAYAASTDIAYGRDVPATILGGMLASEVWQYAASSGGGGGGLTVAQDTKLTQVHTGIQSLRT
jgi:hypothetical protein